jgi:hypothetical protein
LPPAVPAAILPAMWNEPYLETCCRSALHRLLLCGDAGRPDAHRTELKDARCLERLEQLGFADHVGNHFEITRSGRSRHDREIRKVA